MYSEKDKRTNHQSFSPHRPIPVFADRSTMLTPSYSWLACEVPYNYECISRQSYVPVGVASGHGMFSHQPISSLENENSLISRVTRLPEGNVSNGDTVRWGYPGLDALSSKKNESIIQNSTSLTSFKLPPFAPIFSGLLQRRRRREARPRRQRTTFSSEQTVKLEVEYGRTEYISRSRRYELAERLHLSENQIKIWFQNRRAKEKRIEKAQLDHQIRNMSLGHFMMQDLAESRCHEVFLSNAFASTLNEDTKTKAEQK